MNIREFRAERRLSQEELGEKLGVTKGAVSQWELGTSFPSGRTAARLIAFSDGLITMAEIYAQPEHKAAA